MAELGTITYFPLLAKGLAPTLVAEHSGLPYKGIRDTGFTMDQWGDSFKAKCGTPFGQLPILDTGAAAGVIGQTTAICNHIGWMAKTDGKDANEYAMSQMLMAEGEDLYGLMLKYQPTIFVKEKSKEDHTKFWSETVPAHMTKLEALISKRGPSSTGFTSTGTSPGELLLFANLYQMSLVSSDLLASTPTLLAWFNFVRTSPATARVLSGQSAMGKLQPYFIKMGETEAPPEPEVTMPAEREQKNE